MVPEGDRIGGRYYLGIGADQDAPRGSRRLGRAATNGSLLAEGKLGELAQIGNWREEPAAGRRRLARARSSIERCWFSWTARSG